MTRIRLGTIGVGILLLVLSANIQGATWNLHRGLIYDDGSLLPYPFADLVRAARGQTQKDSIEGRSSIVDVSPGSGIRDKAVFGSSSGQSIPLIDTDVLIYSDGSLIPLPFAYLVIAAGEGGTLDNAVLVAEPSTRSTLATPIPSAVWLFATGLVGLGLVGNRRRFGSIKTIHELEGVENLVKN